MSPNCVHLIREITPICCNNVHSTLFQSKPQVVRWIIVTFIYLKVAQRQGHGPRWLKSMKLAPSRRDCNARLFSGLYLEFTINTLRVFLSYTVNQFYLMKIKLNVLLYLFLAEVMLYILTTVHSEFHYSFIST